MWPAITLIICVTVYNLFHRYCTHLETMNDKDGIE